MSVVLIDSYTGTIVYQLGLWPQWIEEGMSYSNPQRYTLDKVIVSLKRVGSPGGNMYARIYAHTGTFGVSSLPTGSVLATSDAISTNSISTSAQSVTFNFSSTNRITLYESTYYVIELTSNNGDASNYIGVGAVISGSASGNMNGYDSDGGRYNVISSYDMVYEIYGEQVSPVVTTQPCSSVAGTTATFNGTVTTTGGASVTRRGFCYKTGTSGDPTVSDTTVYDDGTFGIASYTEDITGLTAATGYRVRAYAINSIGTSYGTTVQLTTASVNAPTVTTTAVSRVYREYAIVGGNVTDIGDSAVTERGIYLGTTEETQATKIVSSNGIGTYTVCIPDLDEDTAYYYKSFATNTNGTSYGDILSFHTAKFHTAVGGKAALPPFKTS